MSATLPARSVQAGLRPPWCAGHADRSCPRRVRSAGHFRHVRGDPFRQLCAVAADVRADAIVAGASEHLARRLAGSLAVRLVRAGKWPVTVVP